MKIRLVKLIYCEPEIQPGAFEPEPRLVPPLVKKPNGYFRAMGENVES